jgi:aspartate aminotransferase
VLADLIAQLSPNAAIWNTQPGYINHQPIMEGAGLKVSHFRWQDKNEQLDIESCFADLEYAAKGDVILLHGCCHNPTGIDASIDQWQQLVDFCKAKELVPFIDMAYQGFGDNPNQDAAGLRLFVEQMDVVLIATSCSKNMGLYCERTGAATVITPHKTQIRDLRALLERITRAIYSVPPHHGSAVASLLFDHPEPWLEELSKCRNRVAGNRRALADALNELGAPSIFNGIAMQKGMFSLLPLSADQMRILREEFAIYGLTNGRINIAGLKQSQIKILAHALVNVVSR